jgi:lysyl-tRNA synthetase class I
MGSSGQSYSSDFERSLQLYRSNIVQYKVSGNAAFKTAADNAKKWLDEYIASQTAVADASKKEIQDFVKNYENSDQELAKLKNDMRTIRTKGPELQTLYETERESQTKMPIDFGMFYTKGAILGGVAALIVVASIF